MSLEFEEACQAFRKLRRVTTQDVSKLTAIVAAMYRRGHINASNGPDTVRRLVLEAVATSKVVDYVQVASAALLPVEFEPDPDTHDMTHEDWNDEYPAP